MKKKSQNNESPLIFPNIHDFEKKIEKFSSHRKLSLNELKKFQRVVSLECIFNGSMRKSLAARTADRSEVTGPRETRNFPCSDLIFDSVTSICENKIILIAFSGLPRECWRKWKWSSIRDESCKFEIPTILEFLEHCELVRSKVLEIHEPASS